MKYIRSLDGQNTPYIHPFPAANSTSDIVKGCPVTMTAETVGGGITVVTANTIADVLGITAEMLDYSVDSAYSMAVTATACPEILVDIRPLGIAEADLVETGSGQAFGAEEAVGQTALTMTAVASDDDFNGCFMYDDGTEQLRFVTDSANSGETITVSALTTVIAAAVLVVFSPPRLSGEASTYRQMTGSDSNRKVLYDGLVNSYPWARVLDNHIIPITGRKLPKERLIPWKHNACTTNNAVLSTQFVITDQMFITQ